MADMADIRTGHSVTYIGKSLSKSKYAASLVEFDACGGNIMGKLREKGLDKKTSFLHGTTSAEPGEMKRAF
ncbi:MAG TPA: hypothetical protein VL598_16270 [Trinickia sp.]|jgi:hypothetical protein|uniref:hypothetical protein n=1 Tax=Trinickia sp. TaxID=2571163 RepID=UPI002D12F822|nr:hypothetical protein [Trinickia sp.]HTI19207.1 hypothetical protein [Trinickia sp.]